MDKIQKFLLKLSKEERTLLAETIKSIHEGKTKELNTKKLAGYKDIYRVRVGQIRIIYKKKKDDIQILETSFRSEKTYRKY